MDTPRISHTEWAVMKILWKTSPLAAREVVEALTPSRKWNHRTIKTFLNRLIRKGAVGYHALGKTYTYYPRVSEAVCVRAENESFLQRVHDGAIQSMLSSFLDTRRMSPREIQELKRILDQKRK